MALPPKGLIVPTLCFFDEHDHLDLPTISKHAIRLAKAGVAALTVHGSTGEPCFLTREERRVVLETTKKALDESGSSVPMIAGCGVPSTWETIDLCKEAKNFGATFALVLPPSYFKSAMTEEVIENFFIKVADESPIPIILYNFPGVSNGIDMSESLICRLASHSNIVGIKLSCGNVGKGVRLGAKFQGNFAIYLGLADTMLHGISLSNLSGAVSGLGNVCPRAGVKVHNLLKDGKLAEATELQKKLTLAGQLEVEGGIPAVRFGVNHYFGYGGKAREPMPDASPEIKEKTIEWCDHIMDLEYEAGDAVRK